MAFVLSIAKDTLWSCCHVMMHSVSKMWQALDGLEGSQICTHSPILFKFQCGNEQCWHKLCRTGYILWRNSGPWRSPEGDICPLTLGHAPAITFSLAINPSIVEHLQETHSAPSYRKGKFSCNGNPKSFSLHAEPSLPVLGSPYSTW